MNKIIFTALVSLCSLFVSAQLTVIHSGKSKEITVYGAKLCIVVGSDGRYSFSYTNGLKGGLDFRNIMFKNKKDAKAFVDEIGKAFSLMDGEINTIKYSKYEINLSISPLTKGVVFMMVKEKDLTESALDITKEMYDQVNIL